MDELLKECVSHTPSADYTSGSGASVIKAMIEKFWRRHGFDVQVVLIPGPFSPALRTSRFDVRSDLVNGMPRGAASHVAGA